MAYKFQLGPATLSGSLTQEGQILAKDSALSGSSLSLNGVAVTSTAAELNKLDGADSDVTAAKLNTLCDLTDSEIAFLDGATAGAAVASKAVVLDGSRDVDNINNLMVANLSASAAIIIGSANINQTDLEQIDDITAGTAAASKAVVLDGSKNIATIGTIGCGAITSTGASSMGSLDVGGTLACDTSFTIDSTVISAAEIGVLDSVTPGTVAASKALVADANTLVKFANGSLNGIMGASDTDNAIQFGNSQNASLYFEASAMEGMMLHVSASGGGGLTVMSGESQNAVINLAADEHDDAGDMWEIACQASNDKFTLSNDIAQQGNQVEHFSITPHATASNSTAAFAGNVTIGGDLTVNGDTVTVNVATLTVEDKNIHLAKGATGNGARGAGLDFELDGDVDAGFIRVGASDDTIFELQAPGNSNVLTLDMDASGEIEFSAAKKLTVGGNFDIDADITTPAANINLLTAGAGSSVSLEGADGLIIFDNDDSNAAKKVLVSDISGLSQTLAVAAKVHNDSLEADKVNFFADLDTSGNSATVTLPASAASLVGKSVYVKAKNLTNGATITVNTQASAQKIDGADSIILESPFAAVRLIYVATNDWRVF